MTWIRGRHSLKFGAETRWQQLNDANHFDLGGNFNFITNQTANGSANGFREGWPIASLITGAPVGVTLPASNAAVLTRR